MIDNIRHVWQHNNQAYVFFEPDEVYDAACMDRGSPVPLLVRPRMGVVCIGKTVDVPPKPNLFLES